MFPQAAGAFDSAPARTFRPAARSSDTGVCVIGLVSREPSNKCARGTDATPPPTTRQGDARQFAAACRQSARQRQHIENKRLFVGDDDLDAAVARSSRQRCRRWRSETIHPSRWPASSTSERPRPRARRARRWRGAGRGPCWRPLRPARRCGPRCGCDRWAPRRCRRPAQRGCRCRWRTARPSRKRTHRRRG